MSGGLVEFLRARLADDEQVARAAGSIHWRQGAPDISYDDDGAESSSWRDDHDGVCEADPPHEVVVYDEGRPSRDQAEHIARHDPARVLAEVAAKRAILARLADTAPPYADSWQQEIHETLRDEVIPHLAAGHAEHPEYRQEWNP